MIVKGVIRVVWIVFVVAMVCMDSCFVVCMW
jgi:hypothetical protein